MRYDLKASTARIKAVAQSSRKAGKKSRHRRDESEDHQETPKGGGGDVQRELADAFLMRAVQLLKRLSDRASVDVLKASLGASSDVEGVAMLLSNLAPLDADLEIANPLAAAMARGAAMKTALLKRAGGALTSTEVARVLGITRQAVDKRRERRALLAVPSGSGDHLYPRCQFTPDGPLPHLADVLRAFRVNDPWTQLSILIEPAISLNGKSVLDALRAGAVDESVRIARAFGEQGG